MADRRELRHLLLKKKTNWRLESHLAVVWRRPGHLVHLNHSGVCCWQQPLPFPSQLLPQLLWANFFGMQAGMQAGVMLWLALLCPQPAGALLQLLTLEPCSVPHNPQKKDFFARLVWQHLDPCADFN